MSDEIRLTDEELTAITAMVMERFRNELRESERIWKQSSIASRIRRRLTLLFGRGGHAR